MGELSIKRYQHIHNLLVNEALRQKEIIEFINIKDYLKSDNQIEAQQIPNLLNQTLLPISLYNGDLCIGICCLHDIDWENRNAQVKFIFDEYYNNSDKVKIITECIKMIINFITNHFYIIKIDGVVIEKTEVINKVVEENFIIQNHIEGNGIIYVTKFLKADRKF